MKTSYVALLRNLDSIRPVLERFDIPTDRGRFQDLLNAVEYIEEAFRDGRLDELIDGKIKAEAMWGLLEALELTDAVARLAPLDPRGFGETLRMALMGEADTLGIPVTPEFEGRSAVNRARNSMYELVVGAHLSHLGDGVEFSEPDVVAPFRGSRARTACKRPFGFPGLGQRVEEGASQLVRSRTMN